MFRLFQPCFKCPKSIPTFGHFAYGGKKLFKMPKLFGLFFQFPFFFVTIVKSKKNFVKTLQTFSLSSVQSS